MTVFVVRVKVEQQNSIEPAIELSSQDERGNFAKIYQALGLSGCEVANTSALDDHIFDVLSEEGEDINLDFKMRWDDLWDLRGIIQVLMTSQAFPQRKRSINLSIWIIPRELY